MSSTIVADSTDDKDDSLIIIVNADGTITVDPETLQKLIANNHSNNVSLVHVNDPEPADGQQNKGDASQINLTVEGFFPPSRGSPENTLLQDLSDGDAGNDVSDPFSQMEPEHLARLESALQSEHAKEILGTKLDENLTNMLNILEGNDERPSNNVGSEDQHSCTAPPDVHVDHSYHVQPVPAVLHQPSSTVLVSKQPPPLAHTRGSATRLLQGPRVRGRPTRGGLRTVGGIARTLIPGQLQTGVVTSSVSNQEVTSTKYLLGPGGRPAPIRVLSTVGGNRTVTCLSPRGRLTPISGTPVSCAIVSSPVRTTLAQSTVKTPSPSQPAIRKIATTQPAGNISPSPVVSSTTDQKTPTLKKPLVVSQAASLPTKAVTNAKSPSTPQLKTSTPLLKTSVLSGPTTISGSDAVIVKSSTPVVIRKKVVPTRGGKVNRRGVIGRGGVAKRGGRTAHKIESVGKGPALKPKRIPVADLVTESKPEVSVPLQPKEVDLSTVTVSPSIMALIQKKTPHVVLTKLENLPGTQISTLKAALNEDSPAATLKSSVQSKPAVSFQPPKATAATAAPEESPSPVETPPSVAASTKTATSPQKPIATLVEKVASAGTKHATAANVKVSAPVAAKPLKSPKKVEIKDVKTTLEGKKLETQKAVHRVKATKEAVSAKVGNASAPAAAPSKVEKVHAEDKEKEKEKKKKEKSKFVASGPIVLGPELFSTPDIIRRVSTDKPPLAESVTTPEKESVQSTPDDTLAIRDASSEEPVNISPTSTVKESEDPFVESNKVERFNAQDSIAPLDVAEKFNLPVDSKEAAPLQSEESGTLLESVSSESVLNLQPVVTSTTHPKVEVQPVHPPLPFSGNPVLAAESLLDSIHAEVAKSDSALLQESILLDDEEDDDDVKVSMINLEEKVPKDENQIKSTHSNEACVPPSSQVQSISSPVQNNADPSDKQRKLPPIEVPTTRSATKKAALATSPQLPVIPIKKSSQPKALPLPKEQKIEPPNPVVEHRSSTDSHRSSGSMDKKAIVISDMWDSEIDDHGSDVESYNSEDDPNRLWCICQKPHNNRFMICCDGCEDWFHGKCVGITKALGQQMEAQGVEWSCPNCRAAKAKEAQRQNPSKTVAKSPALNQTTLGSLECIICKKPAKVASNFCSDNCIKKHAVTKISGLKKELPSLCLISKVMVYNRTSGKLITGEKAPTVQKLTDWLLSNSGYEVLTPSMMSSSSKYAELLDSKATSQSGAASSPKTISKPPEKAGKVEKAANKIVEKRSSIGSTSSQSFVVIKKGEGAPGDSQKDPPVLKQAVLMPKVVKGEIKVGFGAKPSPASKKIQLIPSQPLNPLQMDTNKTKGKNEDGKRGLKLSIAGPQTPSPTVEKKRDELKSKKEKKPKESDVKLVLTVGNAVAKPSHGSATKTPTTPTLSSPPTTPLSSKEKPPIADKAKEKAPPVTEKEETPKQESIRDNVKRMLQETLTQRISHDSELKTTADEIRSLVESIEEELFNFFKDTGVKYRAKFRSLIFNIKDAKNHTLYKKIVEKAVSPSELVRLTPEELASQELAQWREKEAKHQIEMIKKNELALIHQAKTVVLKSRKGEEIIESKNHEANISELESALNRTADDYEEPVAGAKKEPESLLNLPVINKDKLDKKEDRKKERDKERKKDRKRSHRSRSKSRDKRSRSRSRGRKRTRSKSKERARGTVDGSKERDKDRAKRSRSQSEEKSNKKARSRSKSRERSKSRTSSKSRGRSKSRTSSKTRDRSKSRTTSKSRGRSKSRGTSKSRGRSKGTSERSHSSGDNLVELPLENTDGHFEEYGGSLTPPPPSFGVLSDSKYFKEDDLSDREPSSTVFITTPPTPEEKPAVWTGTLNMSEVTTLFASAYEVSGSCEDLEFELSDNLECIGRIQPDSVWEYVSRMKKAGTKDIIVVRFQADSEVEKINYVSLYSYLSTRNRMAVIGHVFKTVKDFYVMPLPSHSPIPQVLLPLDGPGFEETRPHLLLGIIVRNRKGVYGSVPSYGLNTTAPVSKKRPSVSAATSATSERSYTPPLPDGTPASHTPQKLLPPPLPTVSMSPEQDQEDDEEQPYDPGEGQDEGIDKEEPYSPSSQNEPDIAKNLEEVKKLIEEKKQKIEALIPTIPGIGDTPPPYSTELNLNVGGDEAYSPPESFTPPPVTSDGSLPFFNTKTLPDIKLPSNLQEILASIKGSQIDPKLDPIIKAYTTSQKSLIDEEESVTDDESEKSGSMASDTSHSKSRDPRQRMAKPLSLGQLSDIEILKKAAEMESLASGSGGGPPLPSLIPPMLREPQLDSPHMTTNAFYALPPPPLPPYPPPLPPGMNHFPKVIPGQGMNVPVSMGMPQRMGPQGMAAPLPPMPPHAGAHMPGPPPLPLPPIKRPSLHFMEGQHGPPPPVDPLHDHLGGGPPPPPLPPTRQLRDVDMRSLGPGQNWPDHHPSRRNRGNFHRKAGGGGGGNYRRGKFQGDKFKGRSGRNQAPNRIQSEWDEEIRNFEQRRARENERRKRMRSRSPSPSHRRHRRHGRPPSPSEL